MMLIDSSGNNLLLNGLGSSAWGTDGVSALLSSSGGIPAVQLRRGAGIFGQVLGTTANGINFDATGGAWRWRSVLNDDNATRMLLDSLGLTVTGRYLTSTTVLEPFSSTQNTTNGVQFSIGAANAWRATFGTRYSQGDAFIGHNTRQTVTGTDQWQQTTPAGSTWDSLALFLNGNVIEGIGGLKLKRAAHGTAANTFANFWSDLFTITLAGDVTTHGTSMLLNNATSNLIQFRAAGDAAPSFTTRSAGTKVVLWPSLSGTQVDYALGIYNGALWASVPTTSFFFRWYGGTTELMNLTGTGLSFYGGAVYLGNGTSNLLWFNVGGVDVPTLTSRSTGTKIALYPSVASNSLDYAVGVASGVLWFSIPTVASSFKWYGAAEASPYTPTVVMSLTGGSLVLGSAALATSATKGFFYIPTMSGAPTGTPVAHTGTVPMVYDTTNNHFYIYNGAWKKVALT
jgi:hypothetical protein